MSDTPKPEMARRGIPAPAPADYSDEITEAQWVAICESTKQHQDCEGAEIISGEPW